ncbi:MAG: (2Fe-2S) ferredoxin domain-containing protein [Planctomycetota bacterium]
MAITKPTYHFLVCNSYRVSGEPQGVCNRKGAAELLQFIENECIDRDIDGLVTATGCLKACEKGPILVIYPGTAEAALEAPVWYGSVDEQACERILDALEEGGIVDDLVI